GEASPLRGAGQRCEGLPRHLVAAGGQAPDRRGVHTLEEHAEGELPGGGVRGMERMLGRAGGERRGLGRERRVVAEDGGGGGHADSSGARRARSLRRAGSRRKGTGGRPSWER